MRPMEVLLIFVSCCSLVFLLRAVSCSLDVYTAVSYFVLFFSCVLSCYFVSVSCRLLLLVFLLPVVTCFCYLLQPAIAIFASCYVVSFFILSIVSYHFCSVLSILFSAVPCYFCLLIAVSCSLFCLLLCVIFFRDVSYYFSKLFFVC